MPLPLDGWREWPRMPIPGSATSGLLQRLHLDPASRATVSLVRFPASWRRPVEGRFRVAEEFVLLAGSITLGADTYRAGDLVFVPADAQRGVSESEGALALAWFSGVPDWVPGPGGAEGVVRRVPTDTPVDFRDEGSGPGSSRVTETPVSRADRDRDLLQLKDRCWSFVPAGAAAPPTSGLVIERRWAAPGAHR